MRQKQSLAEEDNHPNKITIVFSMQWSTIRWLHLLSVAFLLSAVTSIRSAFLCAQLQEHRIDWCIFTEDSSVLKHNSPSMAAIYVISSLFHFIIRKTHYFFCTSLSCSLLLFIFFELSNATKRFISYHFNNSISCRCCAFPLIIIRCMRHDHQNDWFHIIFLCHWK